MVLAAFSVDIVVTLMVPSVALTGPLVTDCSTSVPLGLVTSAASVRACLG